MKATRECSVPDCDRPIVARTLCSGHYSRAYKNGTVKDFPVRQPGERRNHCTVEGCDDFCFGNGLCQTHYNRFRNRGTVELRGPIASVGYIDRYGYHVIYATGHPLARPSGRISEHRLVAYEKYGPGMQHCHWCGRDLEWSRVCVDHLDGVRLNNVPENLVTSCGGCNSRRARSGNPLNFSPGKR